MFGVWGFCLFHLFNLYVHGVERVCHRTHNTERITCESWFSPFTVWVPGPERGSSGLLANALPTEPTHQPKTGFYYLHFCHHINDFFVPGIFVLLRKNEKEKGWKREIHEKHKCFLVIFRSVTIISWRQINHAEDQVKEFSHNPFNPQRDAWNSISS